MRGPIVCNSGPLIALGSIQQLGLLRELYTEVLVPEPIRKEIEAGGSAQTGLSEFQKNSWLQVPHLAPQTDHLLESLVDSGEASVILTALHRKISSVLIDERKARKVARDIYKLKPIGTARVLVDAKSAGLVNVISPFFKRLQENGYWIHENIVNEALRHAGEL